MSGPASPLDATVDSRPPMPKGVHNVYIYEIFNTTSFIVVLGAPMLLFLQHLGATATVLAVAASLPPVLNILQIPAARFVEQIGYKRFVLSGWTTRSIFIIFMAVIAILPESVDRTTRVVLMLFLSFGYNAMRGIASCGMLPWFTHIVPEQRRGEFLAKDQFAGAVAAIAALFVFGWLLHSDHWYSFGLLFAISALSAFTSLPFLRRVPDVAVEKIVANDNPLPWSEMFFYPPFFKYLRYNIVVNMALGVSGVFWVRFFRIHLHISESYTLLIASSTMMVLAVGLFLIGSMIDRVGNRPVLTASGIMFVLHFLGWALIAGGIVPLHWYTVAIQSITSGLGGALWNLSNVRTVMSIVPVMGRPHFLALYSVTANLTVGLVPLVWGPIMDYLGNWHYAWGWWDWNSFSILYLTLVTTVLMSLVVLRSMPEPGAITWDVFMRELLVETPSRSIGRLIIRLKGPGIG